MRSLRLPLGVTATVFTTLCAALLAASCVVASGDGTPAGQDAGARDAATGDRAPDAGPDVAPGDAAADAADDGAAPEDAPRDAAPGDTAPRTDSAPSDAPPTDAAPADAAPSDTLQSDAAQTDAEQADAPPTDAGTACTQVPAPQGVYSYTIVPVYGVVNPPAAAWHPGGTYALVLNATDKVFRYTSATGAVDQVATLGSSTTWRHVSFTPEGDKAVLLAWDSGASEGRIYLWDHASGTVAEMSPTQRAAGISYESLAWSPGGQAKLLGQKTASGSGYIVYLWPFDATTGRGTVFAANTSAGCQDLAWATDQFDASTVAAVCGINGAEIFYIDGGGSLVAYPNNIGNTSRISGRPQGDYAVAVCNSCNSKLYRFKQGLWDAPYASPLAQGGYQIGFSTDGRRALVLGSTFSTKGRIYEYVHDTYATWDDAHVSLSDVSIENFTSPPYNADTSVNLNDVAWRPGCEEGLVVGGSNTYSSTKGYIIKFSVDNGCTCTP